VNIPEKPVESPERKALIELKKAHLSLRTMFHLLALCSLLIAGALFVILFQQVSLLRRQSDEINLRITEYNNTVAPQLQGIHTNLEAFAATNRSLYPLLRRYFPTNTAGKTNSPKSQAVSTNQ
jgi:hypothetical protein